MINQELIWSEPKIINTSFGICKEIKMAMDYLIKHNIEPNNNLQFIQN